MASVFAARAPAGDGAGDLTVTSVLGAGAFGVVFAAAVAPSPLAARRPALPASLVVKRSNLGLAAALDGADELLDAELPEARYARYLGVPIEAGALLAAAAPSAPPGPAPALPLAPAFYGATVARDGAHVVHLLATAQHGSCLYDAIWAEPERFADAVRLRLSRITSRAPRITSRAPSHPPHPPPPPPQPNRRFCAASPRSCSSSSRLCMASTGSCTAI